MLVNGKIRVRREKSRRVNVTHSRRSKLKVLARTKKLTVRNKIAKLSIESTDKNPPVMIDAFSMKKKLMMFKRTSKT